MSLPSPKLDTRLLSSLTKVFADAELQESPYQSGTSLRNEVYNFQVAYRSNSLVKGIKARVISPLSPYANVYTVGLAPSELANFAEHDDYILRDTPGLYPDPLYPHASEELPVLPGQWRSVWVSLQLTAVAPAGIHPIEVQFVTAEGDIIARETFTLEVIAAELPPQRLIHTTWFHTDCLANYYGDEVFSEEHWQRIEQFVGNAVNLGINMILTPLFTPPLDTAIGGERRTVQLIDVEVVADGYTFGFNRLDRWVDMCLRQGVSYFEMSHLFTQWGAKHAPKIMATVNGEYKQIFGWDTDAAGPVYSSFLRQMVPALLAYLKDKGIDRQVYFHVSDEPHLDHLEQYGKASAILSELLGDYPIIDALSDYDFYEKGLVRNPIPANDHIEPFIANHVEPLWTYYCCGQFQHKVSNRFFGMPSARNRILGTQLYKFGAQGFLHWGYNFWNTQNSIKAINPFEVTDAGRAFPSGDAFLVYPGQEGPINSIRGEVMREAMQDLRALQLLEQRIGKERIIAELEKDLASPITFREYPRELTWMLRTRQWVNEQLKSCL